MSLRMPESSRTAGPLPEAADVVIIGSGIMGLATAYHAARLGQKKILVLDRGYLCGGASGRNGGGVRTQWSQPEDIALMQESVQICRDFAQDMGVNIWFRQGGYMFLVTNEADLPALKQCVEIQRNAGGGTQLITPQAAKAIVPELEIGRVIAASHNADDGVLFPWPFIWGYAHGALDLGVQIRTFVDVIDLETTNGAVTAVVTDRGKVKTDHVINAAGCWTPQIAALAGVTLPNRPVRHEILTTEPLKPFLKPMVTVLGESIYFSQSMRGEIVGGMGDPEEESSYDISSSLAFLRRFSKAATRLMPALNNVQVVRQWAGSYDVSPDGRPILGETESATNLTHLAGFVGRGFMMAPVVGKLCAERLVNGAHVDYFEQHGLGRFADGGADYVELMDIG